MTSKYCTQCEKIISLTNSTPHYCCWCGGNLEQNPILDEFNSLDERNLILLKCKQTNPVATLQLKFF
uniref:Uncharacterized protein n=1 Tax=Dulem virus 31 TaxID=3145749 RepID=A0AAU8AT86_9VIRU